MPCRYICLDVVAAPPLQEVPEAAKIMALAARAIVIK